MAPQSFPYKCLAFHGPMLYEAKTIKIWGPEDKTVRTKASENSSQGYLSKGSVPSDLPPELEKKIAYYIHYKGWKSTWDEWVSEDRVLAWNEENLRTQKELKQMALAAASKKRHGATSSVAISVVADNYSHGTGLLPAYESSTAINDGKHDANGHSHNDKGTTGETAAKKREGSKEDATHFGRASKRARGVDMDLEKEDDYIRRPEVSLTVPDPLKSILVDDWELITKEHQIVPLPRETTVSQVLEMFRSKNAHKKKGGAHAADFEIFEEVLAGIKVYFDRSLGSILLYRFERQQYATIKKENPDTDLCDIYGPEHLLRLFVSFPALIAQTNMDQQSITILRKHLEDLLKFLTENRNKLFLKEYETATPQYEAAARAF